MKQKLLLLLLPLLLCGTPSLAHDIIKVEGIYYSFINNNTELSVSSLGDNSYSGEVEIPATVTYIGNTYEVTSIGSHAFGMCKDLTAVTIPNSVTSIGNDAFAGCTGLKSVNITDIASWCKINFNDASSNPLYYAKSLYLNGTQITKLNPLAELNSENNV